MPGLDDHLTEALRTVDLHVDTEGVVARVAARRRRRDRVARLRVPAVVLALVVIFVGVAVVRDGDEHPDRAIAVTRGGPRDTGSAVEESTTTAVQADVTAPPASAAPEADRPPMTLVTMSFVDADHGWAILRHEVYATDDGGATYSVAGRVRGGNVMQFVDRAFGWVVGSDDVGSYVERTTDGGRSWSLHRVPFDVYKAAFGDRTHGWSVTNMGAVAATTDGGVTWTRQAPPAVDAAPYFVETVDSSNVWIGCENSPYVLHSADGGGTWVIQTLPADLAEADLIDLEFISPTRGWALTTEGAVFTTSDGGSTWTRLAFLGGRWWMSITAGDETHLWTTGVQEQDPQVTRVMASVDGGATWSEQFRHDPPDAFGLIQAVSSTHVWVAGRSGIWRTTDGKTWRR
jgi:photosystem II stability/assembly factor-like uncharacterized protein